MYPIQIADQTFIAADQAIVADYIHIYDWEKLWPGFLLEVTEDRNLLGIRWKVGHPIIGTMEIWLQEHLDGVLLHYFVHAELSDSAKTKHSRKAQEISQRSSQIFYRFWATVSSIIKYPQRTGSELEFINSLLENRWDEHTIRRHARKIAHRIKSAAESGRSPGDPAYQSHRPIVH